MHLVNLLNLRYVHESVRREWSDQKWSNQHFFLHFVSFAHFIPFQSGIASFQIHLFLFYPIHQE